MIINFLNSEIDPGEAINNPLILSSVVLLLLAILIPCAVWFLRNFLRIIMKRNYEWLNRSLKWFFLGGVVVFVVFIIIIILAMSGMI